MKKTADAAIRWYNKLVLDHPVLMMVCILLVVLLLSYKARDFRIDASAESILLENDRDLHYSRQVNQRYGVNDFLLIAYVPRQGGLLEENNLKTIAHLRDELAGLPAVDSVLTILDVPLFNSPPISYADLAEGLPTLSDTQTDKAMAAVELKQSPFYRDLLVSRDMTTTALIVNLKIDVVYKELLAQRNALKAQIIDRGSSAALASDLDRVQGRIREHLYQAAKAQHENIAAVRAIMETHKTDAKLYLGGISMIQDDMISFVRGDLENFGIGVFLLLILMLGIIFRRLRWIVLPMLCCLFSVLAMMGILAMFGWEVTVISSNFISLQLIITLALAVHLIVRYREYMVNQPDEDQRALVKKTIASKFIPSLYAVLTTIAGFCSLLLCDIKPVINFGWMMSAGLVVSLLMTFVLFPAFLMLMKKDTPLSGRRRIQLPVTRQLGQFTEGHGTLILVATLVISLLIVLGVSRLRVENSFIDYFKKSTEIYRGMSIIDQKLGGTTPLDVIVQFQAVDLAALAGADEEEEEDLLNPYGDQTEESYDKYWFFEDRMRVIEQVHDYLEQLPETGKVLSLGTLLKIARSMNNGKSLDSIEMAVLYTKVPEAYRDLILKPYLSIPDNEVRFSVRIIDSLKNLQRDALLKQIKRDLTEKIGLAPEKVHLAGTMVLYDNMLSSQVKTLGVVVVALLAMFLILFRSIKLALIALFPNLFSAGVVLAVMGWLNIPLDMMTITIASITMGIAVDDTIHYIHRFKQEITRDGDYLKTMHRCHGSIGYAMFYTSITIVIGFSILSLSNFWPTIYFGLFTGLAMVIALLTALTLLPWLIMQVKPFGTVQKDV